MRVVSDVQDGLQLIEVLDLDFKIEANINYQKLCLSFIKVLLTFPAFLALWLVSTHLSKPERGGKGVGVGEGLLKCFAFVSRKMG